MTSGQVEARLDKRPFKPARLHLSDGAEFDINRPEDARVIGGMVEVGPEEEVPAPWARLITPRERVQIDPHHITRMENLAARSLPGGNGSGG